MREEEKTALMIDACRRYDGPAPSWLYRCQDREICEVFPLHEDGRTAVQIELLNDGAPETFSCVYDPEQTMTPGLQRPVRRTSDGRTVGMLTCDGLFRAVLNGHIFAEAEGLRIRFTDAPPQEGGRLVARCWMYDDRGTAFLRTTRAGANWFSIRFEEDTDPADRLMILLYPVIGFV